MKILKRILIIIIITMIIFTSIRVPKVYAIDNMILDNAYNRQLIATMIIASGMVFSTTKQIDDSVTLFIDLWNDHETGWRMPKLEPEEPDTWETIIATIMTSKIVYDMASGTYNQIIELGAGLLAYFKDFVDMNYQAFTNWIFDPRYWVMDAKKTYYFPEKHNDYYLYWINADGSYSSTYRNHYIKKNDVSYRNESGRLFKLPFQVYLDYLTSTWQPAPIEYDGTKNWLDSRSSSSFHGVMVSTVPLQTGVVGVELPVGNDEELGYGNPDIVDNPDYEYLHNETGTPTIVMPIQSPDMTEDGYFVPDVGIQDLVDVSADDIANERTDGIIIPAPVPSPSPVPAPYPEFPEEDVATDIDFDTPNKRALYQLKFPFCLPWDIKSIFNLFNAPAKAPLFKVDFVTSELKSKIGIVGSTEFVIDFEEFSLIGEVVRFFTFIGFCLSLILITRGIIKS